MSPHSPATAPAIDAEPPSFNRIHAHPHCVVCSPDNPRGLHQEFTLQPDGSVAGTFYDGEMLEGYPGLLHGGIVAALLDGAMTNCLFAHNIEALTAELTIRYHAPVSACGATFVRAFLTRSRGRLHLLHAELRQEGHLKATALAKFLEQPD
jgi:acyl-coenzyme A thioesterase PaaI-like protein